MKTLYFDVDSDVSAEELEDLVRKALALFHGDARNPVVEVTRFPARER